MNESGKILSEIEALHYWDARVCSKANVIEKMHKVFKYDHRADHIGSIDTTFGKVHITFPASVRPFISRFSYFFTFN